MRMCGGWSRCVQVVFVLPRSPKNSPVLSLSSLLASTVVSSTVTSLKELYSQLPKKSASDASKVLSRMARLVVALGSMEKSECTNSAPPLPFETEVSPMVQRSSSVVPPPVT